ncbi:FAD-dependent oxidoreductase, partial [Thioclava sp. 15-R06ZXC-3]
GYGMRVLELPETPELRQRYLGQAGQALYLIRPDQIVAARWTEADADTIQAQLAAITEGR